MEWRDSVLRQHLLPTRQFWQVCIKFSSKGSRGRGSSCMRNRRAYLLAELLGEKLNRDFLVLLQLRSSSNPKVPLATRRTACLHRIKLFAKQPGRNSPLISVLYSVSFLFFFLCLFFFLFFLVLFLSPSWHRLRTFFLPANRAPVRVTQRQDLFRNKQRRPDLSISNTKRTCCASRYFSKRCRDDGTYFKTEIYENSFFEKIFWNCLTPIYYKKKKMTHLIVDRR